MTSKELDQLSTKLNILIDKLDTRMESTDTNRASISSRELQIIKDVSYKLYIASND